MKNPISVYEALKIMDESVASQHPRAFHLVFCTADKRRGTGGEQIVFDRAVLLKARLKTEGKDKTENKSVKDRRYPIDVKNLSSREIRHVNIDLIEEINGHPVL